MTDHIECAFEVYADDGVEVFFLHDSDQTVPGDSGAVDQNVDPAEFLDDVVDSLFDRCKIRNVHAYCFCLNAQRFDLLDHFGCFFFRIHVDDDDVSSIGGQLQSCLSADAGSSASNDCCFTIKHCSLLLPVFSEAFPYHSHDTSSHLLRSS